jgi:3-deoxy-manno-octulosonate cytidylyltransferase (CMP-KDO synthetase)
MVQWVYEAALLSGVAQDVIIATPDEEIALAAKRFGAEVVLTRDDHPSGTDRLAEVAGALESEVLINVQGDEPLISAMTIQACAQPFSDSAVEMTSVYTQCSDDELDNPAAVKVVTDLNGFALYFSRHAIPFARNSRTEPCKKHVGIYGFRRNVLLKFAQWDQTPLERAESLEQLRFLEHGVRIKMCPGEATPVAVDTPEQAMQVRALLEAR